MAITKKNILNTINGTKLEDLVKVFKAKDERHLQRLKVLIETLKKKNLIYERDKQYFVCSAQDNSLVEV